MVKLPEASVSAEYGVGDTIRYPDISGCTLQSSGTTPGCVNLKDFDCPCGQVPRLCPNFLSPPIEGQNTLCATLSLFLKSTVAPTGATVMCGTNCRPFW